MSETAQNRTSVAALLGESVRDSEGKTLGRIAEFAIDPATDGQYVTAVILRSGLSRKQSVALLVEALVRAADGGLRAAAEASAITMDIDTAILLERDLLDQQIIDVNGHKVVRVNDVDLYWESHGKAHIALRIGEVEIGPRGALRRLLKGLPRSVVDVTASLFAPRLIPWECVDLIDRDPARRVRLKIGQDRLANMHPSDIAEILEELGPAERDAVFTSLDAETAAEALEEIEPRLQKALLEGMESERIADIVEEMDPGAAADLLSEMSDERSEAILEEMEPEERQEVEDLLEFPGDWAAGRMTTEYVHASANGAVLDAVQALREFEGDLDTISEVYLLDQEERLVGGVAVSRLLLSESGKALRELTEARVVSCPVDANGNQVTELFDKYNLRSLPVLDHHGRLVGVIYAEHVIALLRELT